MSWPALKGAVILSAFGPSYVFASPVFGAQAAISLLGDRRTQSCVDRGDAHRPLRKHDFRQQEQSIYGFGDLYPQASLKWNYGVHNLMTYLMGDIPIGAYDSSRLANLGIGHAAIDWGGGYTYFNPQSGHEFSAVTGFTYNFENPDTDCTNGISWHVDWGASQFLRKQVHVGLVVLLLSATHRR